LIDGAQTMVAVRDDNLAVSFVPHQQDRSVGAWKRLPSMKSSMPVMSLSEPRLAPIAPALSTREGGRPVHHSAI
jgi:hypothetical protein